MTDSPGTAAELHQWADRLETAVDEARRTNPQAAALLASVTQIADSTRALAQDLRNP